jgi:hypothetical protein
MMVVVPMVLAMLFPTVADAAPAQTAADHITLRDGSIVKGLVLSATSGPRGSVEFVVRRAWAEKALEKHLATWDRSAAAARRLAVQQRSRRLEAWRRDRAGNAGPDDRIIPWINRELARLRAPGETESSPLLTVRLPRTGVQLLERRPATVERLLRLAWLSELPDPESMSVDELKNSLETRGYALDAIAKKPPAALDRLLPLAPEAERHWLARRAATELTVDSDLRFVRFQDTVLPDTGSGMPAANAGLTTAVSELKRLLDLDPGPKTDPMSDKLRSVAARGRVGAAVTRLEIQPDMSAVTVETALWVRDNQRWLVFGSRTASVRPDELDNDAGNDLADDPQVKSAFQIIEQLGFGAAAADLKQSSLRIGAATRKALSTARATFNQDLDDLALPVLEPDDDDKHKPPR